MSYTLKKQKYEDIKSKFDELETKYNEVINLKKEDKIDNETFHNSMEKLQLEYKNLRTLLISNYMTFRNMNKGEIRAKKLSADSETAKIFEEDLKQKKTYKKNGWYVKMVDESSNIDEYVENNSHKKRIFVKKNFKKIVIAGALLTSVLALTSCHNKKNTKKVDQNNKTNSIESTETPTATITSTPTVYTEMSKEDGSITLVPLPEINPNEIGIIVPTEEASVKDDNKKSSTSSKDAIVYNVDPETGKIVVYEELNPGVDVNQKSEKTTTTEVVNENSAGEPSAVDANNYKDSTNIPKDEKVTIDEKETRTDVVTENIPIEGEKEPTGVDYKPTKKPEPTIPSQEIVTVITEEVKPTIDLNVEVDESTPTPTKIPTSKVTPTAAITPTEKVTYYEEEEKVDIDYNIPIEEDDVKTLSLSR